MASERERRPAWSAPGSRGPDEVARILDHRAARAVREFTAMATGGPAFLCPICGYRGRFSAKGHKPNVWCPQCDSRPRHRLLMLWMQRRMQLPEKAQVLHFAAEPWMRAEMDRRGAVYRSADINDRFDLRLDIEAIALPDRSVDLVIANHVLEHVDDRAALAELFRILRPGGRAALTVPLVEGWDRTLEGEGLDEAARRAQLGDPDHRRFYGRDVRERVRAAGFVLEEFVAEEPDVSTHALHRGERIFVAQRPAEPAPEE